MPLFPCLKPSVVLSAFSVFALVAILQEGKIYIFYIIAVHCLQMLLY